VNNTVDFSFQDYRKTYLFLKKPHNADIPKDWKWKCGCGTLNVLTSEDEQWCPKCGTRLRIQNQKDESKNVPNGVSFTVVRVAHFTLQNNAVEHGKES